MQKIHHSIWIDAPREKVWHTMLDQDTYRQWTATFDPNSRYVGTWEQGSEIRFIGGSEEEGKEVGGMLSSIKENRLHEFVSIEHLGVIKDGVVDTTSEDVKKWTPAFENYTFTDKDGGTEVTIEVDTPEEYADMFNEQWPKALAELKRLAESR